MSSIARTCGDPGREGTPESGLRSFVLGDEVCGAIELAVRESSAPAPGLDARTTAVAKVAALIAVGAPGASYREVVCAALDLGVRDDEIIGIMLAVAPTVGLPRLVASSVRVASALGYDTDVALESPDPLVRSPEAVGAHEPAPPRDAS